MIPSVHAKPTRKLSKITKYDDERRDANETIVVSNTLEIPVKQKSNLEPFWENNRWLYVE